jgi:hypothetical protein
MTSTRPIADRVRVFVQWFEGLEASEQEFFMVLVHNEKKVRDVVNALASMGQEQRQDVFQRLGWPQDALSRMPPSAQPPADADQEVEWEEWKAAPN